MNHTDSILAVILSLTTINLLVFHFSASVLLTNGFENFQTDAIPPIDPTAATKSCSKAIKTEIREITKAPHAGTTPGSSSVVTGNTPRSTSTAGSL